MIEVVSFSKKYPHAKDFAVENVNMKIADGIITGLIGPNGSGKTTLIKAICGFHFATKGSIKVFSDSDKKVPVLNDVERFSMQEDLNIEKIGYVPENPCLPFDMTVSDFLFFAGKSHGVLEKDLEICFQTVIKQCSLENLVHKKIKYLSKGQKQRVSFAQALIFNPQNLILDEPFSGLDPAQIIQIRELIKKLSAEKAVLISTHILSEIASLCSYLYILSDGKIVGSGSERDILEKENCNSLESAFLKLSSKTNI